MILKGSSDYCGPLTDRVADNIAWRLWMLRDRVNPDDGYVNVLHNKEMTCVSFRKDRQYVNFHKLKGCKNWMYHPDDAFRYFGGLKCITKDTLKRLRASLKRWAKKLQAEDEYLSLAALTSGHVQILYKCAGKRCVVHIGEEAM